MLDADLQAKLPELSMRGDLQGLLKFSLDDLLETR